MSTADLPRHLISIAYAEAAQEYLRSLPLEHFMEALPQGTQRKITLESLDLVHARRPEVQIFNELLVQYPRPGRKKPGQVVPDNMVVRCPTEIKAEGSYDTPLQPEKPFWVLEYVSRHSKRKDYDDSFRKYERELKVPYYLAFYPEDQELNLFRLSRGKYVSVKPNKDGRYAIPELDMEVGLLDRWVRFWYQGQLLPLPGELQRDLDESRRRERQAERRAEQAEQRAEQAEHQAEQDRQARLALERELTQLRRQRSEGREPPAS